MKNNVFRRGLLIGIIVLFVGASVVSVNANINYSKAKDEDRIAEITGDTKEVYNLFGGVNVSCVNRNGGYFKIDWWFVEDRNFTYPITGGMIQVNYTFILRTCTDAIYLIPRIIYAVATIYDKSKKLVEKSKLDVVPSKQAKWESYELFVESYPIPVPPDGYDFGSILIAFGWTYPFHVKGDQMLVPFWVYT